MGDDLEIRLLLCRLLVLAVAGDSLPFPVGDLAEMDVRVAIVLHVRRDVMVSSIGTMFIFDSILQELLT